MFPIPNQPFSELPGLHVGGKAVPYQDVASCQWPEVVRGDLVVVCPCCVLTLWGSFFA